MKAEAETLFRMPLYVVVALWLLHRRASKRVLAAKQRVANVVNFADELAVFGHIDELLAFRKTSWLDRALLWIVSRHRRDAIRASQFGWMVIGQIPKGAPPARGAGEKHEHDR